MGQPSTQASNALVYLTYGAFLYVPPHSSPRQPSCVACALTIEADRSCRLLGCYIAWRLRHQSKVVTTSRGSHMVDEAHVRLGRIPLLKQDSNRSEKSALPYLALPCTHGLRVVCCGTPRLKPSLAEQKLTTDSVATGFELHCVWLVTCVHQVVGSKMRQAIRRDRQPGKRKQFR